MIDTIRNIFGEDIFSGPKTRDRADKRLATYAFLRRVKDMTYIEIGRIVGRDHKTVMSGVERFEGLMQSGDKNAKLVWEKIVSGYNVLQD